MNERGGCQGFHLLVFSARTVKGDILSLFIRKLPAATSHIYYWQTLIHHSNFVEFLWKGIYTSLTDFKFVILRTDVKLYLLRVVV